MDFIERVFGIAPDSGSGSFELLLFAIPLLALGVVALRRRRRDAPGSDASISEASSGDAPGRGAARRDVRRNDTAGR